MADEFATCEAKQEGSRTWPYTEPRQCGRRARHVAPSGKKLCGIHARQSKRWGWDGYLKTRPG